MAPGVCEALADPKRLPDQHRSLVSTLAVSLQRGDGGRLDPQNRVVEAVFVDHGGHALNAEVSLQQADRVHRFSSTTPS